MNRCGGLNLAEEFMNKKMRKLEKSNGNDIEDQTNLDRISNMPTDVLNTILVHLPLRDAARTSVLSSKWRYKWTSISEFVLDDKCFSSSPHCDDRWEEIMKIIRHVQSNHNGSIKKFKLAAYCYPEHSQLGEWIEFVAEKGIEELSLQDFIFIKRFKLPSQVFSCPQLSCLDLYGCIFKLPSRFEGFACLKSLQLNQVSITSETLESLVHSCSVLEKLTLLDIDHIASLRIHNQTLKYLKIDSEFADISLENSPLLDSVDIRMVPFHERIMARYLEQGRACNLLRILGGLDSVRRLILSSFFIEFLANGNITERRTFAFNHLSYLELKEVRFCCFKEVFVTVSMLRSSPNLEELYLSVSGSYDLSKPVLDYLKSQYLFEFSFNRLKEVRIRGIYGTRTEWEFIKLILARSPVLETLVIVKFEGDRIPESLLFQTERASEDVKIVTLAL
ncbi:F-box/FBD/LRR-repeat protein At1g13570-like isoform X1 [Carica papaya]|uniref:F-box/FBD/LRR-repeat protein At1g13570-like isoform X1 n=2 Tax=Carica papaya TaxID=3649 RepID=UPI000B8C996A|nr:F-box/FBD/LRR-repeat protein At1g13570-like isoform X1 [Carica papaya]